MSLLSFDIGIKNLAYCVLCKQTQHIQDWGILNISCDDICEHTNKGKQCIKSATYETTWLPTNIKLCTGHTKLKQYKPPLKKKVKRLKSKNTMHSIGKRMVDSLDKLPHLLECESVIVENQPSLKNPTMKSIQMMVYSYFLIRSNPLELDMINARNKLKVYKGPSLDCPYENIPKHRYKRNKWFAVRYCEEMIQEESESMINLYKTSSKKDDLSDCYLQGIYYLELKTV